VVSALIRLGRKYHFSDLLDAAVERLTFENPTTLEEYDALPESGKTTRIIYYPGLRYDTLTVARENNIQSVLPCAYYCALFHPQVSGLSP
jgi:hypothetical protein